MAHCSYNATKRKQPHKWLELEEKAKADADDSQSSSSAAEERSKLAVHGQMQAEEQAALEERKARIRKRKADRNERLVRTGRTEEAQRQYAKVNATRAQVQAELREEKRISNLRRKIPNMISSASKMETLDIMTDDFSSENSFDSITDPANAAQQQPLHGHHMAPEGRHLDSLYSLCVDPDSREPGTFLSTPLQQDSGCNTTSSTWDAASDPMCVCIPASVYCSTDAGPQIPNRASYLSPTPYAGMQQYPNSIPVPSLPGIPSSQLTTHEDTNRLFPNLSQPGDSVKPYPLSFTMGGNQDLDKSRHPCGRNRPQFVDPQLLTIDGAAQDPTLGYPPRPQAFENLSNMSNIEQQYLPAWNRVWPNLVLHPVTGLPLPPIRMLAKEEDDPRNHHQRTMERRVDRSKLPDAMDTDEFEAWSWQASQGGW